MSKIYCPICNEKLGYYDKKYCGPTCSKIAKDTRDRVYHQNLKYERLTGMQIHKRLDEKRNKIMKICIDCGDEHNRDKTNRCLSCAEKRAKEQSKIANSIIRANHKRKPCRGCGCKLGDDIPSKNRFCSDECKNEHHGKVTNKEEKKVNLRDNRRNKPIDPKWLQPRGSKRGGNITNLSSGGTSMECGMVS
jgi:hypothetical protein